MLSAAPACAADPTFLLAQSEARAGDTVQFSITGAKKRVTYEIEVGGKEVLEGSGAAHGVILGQFTMPDLGASSRTVTVEAEIDEQRGTTVARRKLQYLLPTAPEPLVSGPPPATASGAAPVVPVVLHQAATVPPAPANTISPAAAPVAPAPVGKHASRAPRQARGEPRVTSRNRGPKRHVVVKKRRAKHRVKHSTKRRAARTAPLFDGIPETGSGPESAAQPDAPGFLSMNAIAPPTSVLSAASGDGLNAAVMVPGLLGLVALAIAGTALLRKRLTAPRRS